MTRSTLRSLDRLLDAARLRIMVAFAAPAALRSIAILSIVAAAAAPVIRRFTAADPWWLVILPACGGVAALIGAFRARPDRRRAASVIDASHGFHDACATVVSAPSSPGADATFLALQEEALEELLERVDLRRLPSPVPKRPLMAMSVASMLLLGTVLLVPWPPRSPRASEPAAEEESRTRAAAVDERTELQQSQRVRELAESIEVLSNEGRLEDAERAMDELERRTLELAAQAREGEPGEPGEKAKRALLESASRIGEAAESVSRRTEEMTSPSNPGAVSAHSAESGPGAKQPSAELRGEPDAMPPSPPRSASDPSKERSAREESGPTPKRQDAPDRSGAREISEEATRQGRQSAVPEKSTKGARSRPLDGTRERTDEGTATGAKDGTHKGSRSEPGEGRRELLPDGGRNETRDGTREVAREAAREVAREAAREGAREGAQEGTREAARESGPQKPGFPSDAAEQQQRASDSSAPRMAQSDPSRRSASPDTASGAVRQAPPTERIPDDANQARDRLRQRLEDLSRRAGAEALRDRDDARGSTVPGSTMPGSTMPGSEAPGGTAPESGARRGDAPDGMAQHGESGDDPNRTKHGSAPLDGASEGQGAGAGSQQGSHGAGAAPSAAESRSVHDIEAVRPDPDAPGRILERMRDRDDAAPVSTGAGAGSRTPSAARPGDPSNDPAVAPRFRPLVSRYFERVRPTGGASEASETRRQPESKPTGAGTNPPPARP